MNRAAIVCGWLCGIFMILATSAARAEAPSAPAQPVDFASEIQPLLAGRCLKCHGLSKQEGGLALTDRAAALAKLESGNLAIAPEHPERSELLRRVTARDRDERMPPQGEPLTGAEVELLRRWIAAGAPWPEHWAYKPLVKPAVPPVASESLRTWQRTPIDAFIAAKLAAKALAPSAEADRRTLLRRLSFDLIGLPPTPEEMAAFLADPSPLAYEQAVERLLASAHYGERWARHWMDLARYAESEGFKSDETRPNAWRYRDYLIRALNADKPYKQFLEEQVAGDVLFPLDPWATIATGFLATGPWDESSLRDIREDTVDREVARYLDRDDIVTTVMSTFASTTVHCARCHDHKFDPIKQTEYYGLQAIFAATDKANRPVDSDPAMAARRRELLDGKAKLPTLREGKDFSLVNAATAAELAAWEKSLATGATAWHVVELMEFRSSGGATLTKQDDSSLLSGGERPERDVVTVVARTDLARVTGVRLEVLTDERLPHQGPGRQDNGNLHLNEFSVSHTTGAAPRKLELKRAEADFNQEGWSVNLALDGNPKTAWGIYPRVGEPHRAVFELAAPLVLENNGKLVFELQQIHGEGHLIGRLRLSVTDQPLADSSPASTLPPEVSAVLAVPAEKRAPAERGVLAAWFVGQRLDRKLAALPAAQMVYCGTSNFVADGSFRPAPSPRTVQLLARGNIATPLGEAAPGALALLKASQPPFTLTNEADEGARRAALAHWLSSPQNGLVWRSIANRVWQHHFGRGLVDTPSDFGRMGAPPSHPELLDWLAIYLQEHDGSLKELHRAIVTSAVYRQSSTPSAASAAAQRLDGDNRLLWRQNRRRLDAEAIHDSVLVAAGQLDARMGGPSVKQFLMTPGVHVTPVLDYAGFSASDPANRRRSVYRFVFRTLPDPFMDALDCPDASQLVPQRTESVTALQALATMNDKFVVRQSEHLAALIEAQAATREERVAAAFRRVLGREPSPEERAAVTTYADGYGLANACRWLLNTNEFLFVD